MPFDNEFASYEPLRRILHNEKVNQLQSRMKIREEQDAFSGSKPQFFNIDDLDQETNVPSMILSIDGSYQVVPVKNGYPGAEMGYITVASVLMRMDDIRNIEKKSFIDPKKFRETEEATAFDSVFPGCNIIIDDDTDPKASFRRFLFEQFSQAFAFPDFESLLDTYEVLLQRRIDEGIDSLPKSPLDCFDGKLPDMQISLGKYPCKETGEPLYSTDALRLHELFNPKGTSGEMYGELMFVIERLWLVNILRAFEKKNWLSVLKDVVFVLDGPLAVYSVSAWLVPLIRRELARINALQKEKTGIDLMILGLEKSGQFVSHFNSIDIAENGSDEAFSNNTAFLLDDKYIKNNIVFSQSKKPYGRDTYFGRKFFFKTKNGYKLVPQIACFTNAQQDIRTAYAEQFPRLKDACLLLNELVSSRFSNSISPLIAAHAEAAIPLNLGGKMFEKVAEEIRKRGLLAP